MLSRRRRYHRAPVTGARKRGRPLDEDCDRRILEGAVDELSEAGFEQLIEHPPVGVIDDHRDELAVLFLSESSSIPKLLIGLRSAGGFVA